MDLVKVESQDPNINSEFLYFLMAEKRFKSHCKGYSNGTTVLHLSKNAIPEYLFPMPISSDTIVLFSNYAKTVYAKIIKNISEIQNVTNLRDTLLPKLMSGEIEIN
jgi:type I restriction enzyme S subunit